MSLTRPLTRPLTRALSQSELTQKLGGSFSPFALNPYLLFDARDSMVGTLENPTLDLNPALPETLDVITATRAGTATFTDVNGLIASAPANTVRVDQTQGAELTPTVYQYFSQTDLSNSYWTNRNSTITSGFSSPDGGNNAFKLVASQADGDVFAGASSGNSHTKVASVFAKANSATSKLRIQEQNYTGKRTEFDLNLGTITYSNSSGTSTIENVGDGWYRCAHVETYSSGQGTVAFALRSVTADSLFLFGPQVEEGTTPSSFLANTTGSPKFITGATFGPRVPMILVEPSATNTIRWSESSSAYNYGSGITFESSDVLAPNGQASAFKMTPNGSNNTNRGGSGSSYSGLYNANDVVTTSVWLKTDGYDYFLRVGGFFGAESAMFDSLDGSVKSTDGNVISASSEDYGNGWFRYKVTYTFQNTINNRYLYAGVRLAKRDASNNPVESFDGTGETSGVLVYGTQFELGSLATSYIPTDNDLSGVTRNADDLKITGSAFSSFYNASEGTFYVEAQSKESATYQPHYLEAHDASGQNRFAVYTQSVARVFVTANNSVQAHLSLGSYTANQLQRVAASYKVNDFVGSSNGSSEAGDASGLVPVNPTALAIGRRYADGYHLQGHIKRLLFWPYHSDSL